MLHPSPAGTAPAAANAFYVGAQLPRRFESLRLAPDEARGESGQAAPAIPNVIGQSVGRAAWPAILLPSPAGLAPAGRAQQPGTPPPTNATEITTPPRERE
jgi:hypothetical protein